MILKTIGSQKAFLIISQRRKIINDLYYITIVCISRIRSNNGDKKQTVINMEKRKTTTSSVVKDRYNAKAYQDYKVRIRKDSKLFEQVEAYKLENPQEWNSLVNTLLEDYFEMS